MAGLGSSFPVADPGLHWWLDGIEGAVMGFFSSRTAKVSKKGNISSAALSCAAGQE